MVPPAPNAPSAWTIRSGTAQAAEAVLAHRRPGGESRNQLETNRIDPDRRLGRGPVVNLCAIKALQSLD